MNPALVTLDFDHTIIDDNSDIVVRDLLRGGVPSEVENLHSKNGWTRYMQEVFRLVAKDGYTETHIRKAISSIPPVPDFLTFFHELKHLNADAIIISDSNSFFIRAWLEEYDLLNSIADVFTNPAEFERGVLLIKEYMNQDWCRHSTVNLCKGYILDSFKERNRLNGKEYSRTFYIGDGKNDFCPSLRLTKDDFVFPRVGFPLARKLSECDEIKATVCPWSHTREIMDVIKEYAPL
ncbi:probable phosphatase phospho2 [Cimex lectularius]|uniref:Pyridoxal phosphate phosphatase phospho2 n=1 Tax=Cimex lectularius TaxID=79782 RepID=A0A8I6S4H0_CIMLE|nr:probable phosphatase phospho2 [Cimex lectularius]